MVTKRQGTWLVLLGAAAVALSLLAAACGSGTDAAVSEEANTDDGQPAAAQQDTADDHEHAADHDDADEAAAAVDDHGHGQEVSLHATDFAYEPADITVTAGEPVVLTLENSGSVLHDMKVEGLPATGAAATGDAHQGHATAEDGHGHERADADLHVAAEGGSEGVLEFTPTEPGTYAYYCTVPGHREAGMEGTITVVEG